jgi:cytochrome c
MKRIGRIAIGAMILGMIAGGLSSSQADMVGHGGMVRALAVSPDGSRVLTGSFDYSAKLWSFDEQKELADLNEHQGPINAVAFLPDGKRALTASDDRTVILWDLKTAKPIRILKGHTFKVMTIAVSKDGKIAATGSWDKTMRLWDIATGKQLLTVKHPTPVNAVIFANGDSFIITGAHDGKVRIWNTESGRSKGHVQAHNMGITHLSLSADGKGFLSSSIDTRVKLWNLKSLKQVQVFSQEQSRVLTAALSPDGKSALTANTKGELTQWDLVTGKPVRTVRAHTGMIWGVAFSPDGVFGLSASSDEVVRVWHLATGDRIGIPDEGTSEPQPWLTSSHPGAVVYRKCAKCHSLRADATRRSGPHFAKLFGRKVGTVKGYKYSDVLKKAKFVWSDKSLRDLFRLGPDKFVPGTKMPVQRIENETKLSQLISYMHELTESTEEGSSGK